MYGLCFKGGESFARPLSYRQQMQKQINAKRARIIFCTSIIKSNKIYFFLAILMSNFLHVKLSVGTKNEMLLQPQNTDYIQNVHSLRSQR